MKLSPSAEAMAFKIWQYAHPKGWDVTFTDVADNLGVHRSVVSRICSLKGWGNRMRVAATYYMHGHNYGNTISASRDVAKKIEMEHVDF